MKPVVFLSHSSRDAEALIRLKKLLVARTSGTVDFFLSSDESSITFGRNWIGQILTALSTAQVSFTFLSPNSLYSQWIFFEAGLAYQRGIQVVPIGILGVNIGEVPPPLGLLQGFNLSSAKGLGKIVSILNECFSYSYSTEFTKEEFDIFERDIPAGTGAVSEGSHKFRVFSIAADGERPHELIEARIEPPKMIVKAETWESIGIIENNRYVGRFKFHRGNSAHDLGIHDFVWNGNEFIGSAKIDSGRWFNERLVWKPIGSVDEG